MKYGYTAEEKVILWLDGFEELTYRQKQKILSLTTDATSLINKFDEYAPIISQIVSEETVLKIYRAQAGETELPSLLSALEERDIFFVTIRSRDYPKNLMETPCPPLILYCKGNRALLQGDRFALVGSRRTLPWAQSLARKFAATLSKKFTLVTGLAEGGDAAAIEGALDAGGSVISVLAYGFDFVYPASNADLLRRTIQNGLVVTEHRPEVKPQKYLFPARNRVIAGLVRGVLVVSGGLRSGTSITAGYAAEYGRDVFAFPYNPGITSGAGCNALLKSGAYPVDKTEDILEFYGMKTEEKALPALTTEEEKIYLYLSEHGEAHIEEISRDCGVPVYLLGGILSGLEVKECAARLGGNRYAAVKR